MKKIYLIYVCILKYTVPNPEKSRELFPPLLFKPFYAHVQCRDPKKFSKRFQFEKRRQGFAPLEVITLLYVHFPNVSAPTHGSSLNIS